MPVIFAENFIRICVQKLIFDSKTLPKAISRLEEKSGHAMERSQWYYQQITCTVWVIFSTFLSPSWIHYKFSWVWLNQAEVIMPVDISSKIAFQIEMVWFFLRQANLMCSKKLEINFNDHYMAPQLLRRVLNWKNHIVFLFIFHAFSLFFLTKIK